MTFTVWEMCSVMGTVPDNRKTSTTTQTRLHSFLNETLDWDSMDLGGHEEKSLMQDSQGPLMSPERSDVLQTSSVEMSPSNSSGGTYMWDEEGLEPLGGPVTHPCDSYDDSELNSMDILNNLDPPGTGELDDDDLMLDVDLPEDGLHETDRMSHIERSERAGRQGQRRKHHRWSGPDHFHNDNRSHVFQHYDGLKASRISPRQIPSEGRQHGYIAMLDELTLEHMTQDCSSLKNQLLRLKTLLQIEDTDSSADAPEEIEDNTTASQNRTGSQSEDCQSSASYNIQDLESGRLSVLLFALEIACSRTGSSGVSATTRGLPPHYVTATDGCSINMTRPPRHTGDRRAMLDFYLSLCLREGQQETERQEDSARLVIGVEPWVERTSFSPLSDADIISPPTTPSVRDTPAQKAHTLNSHEALIGGWFRVSPPRSSPLLSEHDQQDCAVKEENPCSLSTCVFVFRVSVLLGLHKLVQVFYEIVFISCPLVEDNAMVGLNFMRLAAQHVLTLAAGIHQILQPFNPCLSEHPRQGRIAKTPPTEGRSDLSRSRPEEGTQKDADSPLEDLMADASGSANPDELSHLLSTHHLHRPGSEAYARDSPASAAQSAGQHGWKAPAATLQNPVPPRSAGSACPRMLQPPRLHKHVSLPALKPGATGGFVSPKSGCSLGTLANRTKQLPPPTRGLPCFNASPQRLAHLFGPSKVLAWYFLVGSLWGFSGVSVGVLENSIFFFFAELFFSQTLLKCPQTESSSVLKRPSDSNSALFSVTPRDRLVYASGTVRSTASNNAPYMDRNVFAEAIADSWYFASPSFYCDIAAHCLYVLRSSLALLIGSSIVQGTSVTSLEGEMPDSFSSSGNAFKYSQVLQARRLNLSVVESFGGKHTTVKHTLCDGGRI
ncbi:Serine-rich coiled-coil domain-containing protein 2 [Collichthys lucidus]|uniref:Serine-rich coiled-coil domain-containing protein 2 n=1 Tax=Collichthys lucidus TaxID=240159 RepID=A0A4V6ARV2_COLLU|nr:Serine-rich coiled-coil domain-containing protein 2 [Collichthys lucidus]